MTTPFIVTKSRKSIGLAILLTILFGPIGLFYASITGGLIMTFTPILLVVVFVVGLLNENVLLVGLSSVLILISALTFWILNIIWAIVGVNDYNKEIEREAIRQHDLWKILYEKDQKKVIININQDSVNTGISGQGTVGSTRPDIKDWLKQNPGRTINDYFMKFGRD